MTSSASLLRVLVVGFTAVIVLLLAAGGVAIYSARPVREGAASLASAESATTHLLAEVEREQDAIDAVFYRLSLAPGAVDKERVLAELDQADEGVGRVVEQASGTPDAALWSKLRESSLAFSAEARRLLDVPRVSSYSSQDLFRRHEEVTSTIAKLIRGGYQRAIEAQRDLGRRSSSLLRDSLVLIGACLVAALACAWLTVRIASTLFRKMEWQTSELSRVSFHLLENQETTARRFSHELHDELGQSLTAVKANLMALEAGGERVEDCRRLVDESISHVRELSQLLRPTILDDFGLDASVRWLAERFQQRTGIEVDYQSSFDGRVADETETHLFRIVQEALTNAARHSGATRVEIRLRADGDRVVLSLQDNGRGMDEKTIHNGMGMTGMRARARGAGGELEIHSKPAGGVAIEAWAPRGHA